jgi:uncharacterized protein YabE (DUF348 family)/3D (Asp-Asp-Asp) domain-containing protein
LVICFVCCILAAASLPTEKTVTIDIDGQTQQVVTRSEKVTDILQENNIAIYEGDLVQPQVMAKVEDQDTISITRAFDFSVYADGQKTILRSTPLTVREALAMAGVILGEFDQVSMPLDTIISSPKKVIVARVDVEYITRQVEITAPVQVKRSNTLAAGTTKVLQEGANGLKEEVLAIYSKDGKELTRQVTESTIIKEAKAKIVAKGAMQVASRSGSSAAKPANNSTANASSGSATTSSKPDLAGKKTLTVKAYAYSGGGKTAMGTKARVGVIAVDPKIIPLGTKVYVEGYGYAVAEDTGGNIKGNTIDCYMKTESACINWGIKKVKVYIL